MINNVFKVTLFLKQTNKLLDNFKSLLGGEDYSACLFRVNNQNTYK